MQRLGNPVPLFLDTRGLPLTGGYIYVGVANQDPVAHPISLFWDSALTQPAVQPLRTIGGLIVNSFTPASVFMAEADYSIRWDDSNSVQVDYSPSVFTDVSAFQPHSATLDLLAALSTTSFGRSLLGLANSAALATATGIPTPLPAAGGTVTGTIIRGSAGAHQYWVNASQTSGRVFYTVSGAADPTSLPGDLWIEY
jgi:hypothetical protein